MVSWILSNLDREVSVTHDARLHSCIVGGSSQPFNPELQRPIFSFRPIKAQENNFVAINIPS